MTDKEQCEVIHAFLSAHAIKCGNLVLRDQVDLAYKSDNLALLQRLKNGVLGDELHELQRPHNDGRGVTCVRDIVAYIHHGDYEGACAVTSHDWDKIANYRNIAEWLKNYKFAGSSDNWYISTTAE